MCFGHLCLFPYDLFSFLRIWCLCVWWAWAGEGRARQPGDHWAPGDDLLGDPPLEPQGWYSVFDADAQAGAAIASAAAQMRPARPEGTFY